MIKAKIASNPNILVVFDMPQSKAWNNQGMVTPDGIAAFLQRFMAAGIDLPSELSAVCLADSLGAKASHYKEKQPYIAELIDTHAFNVIVPVGAKAFEIVMGHKGIERYFGKTIESSIYMRKVIPCPNPSMIKFKPEIKQVLEDTIALISKEKDFPEIVEEAKKKTDYSIVDTIDKVKQLVAELMVAPVVAFDLETTGFQHNVDEILTAQFTYKSGQSALIPTTFYKNPDGTNKFWSDEEWDEVVALLTPVFKRRDIRIVGHNIKFDLKFVHHWWGVPVPKPENLHDTMLMSFTTDENSANDLKTLACLLTDLGDYEFELEAWKRAYCKANKLKISEFSYKYVPFEILAQYALTDTDATFRILEVLLPKLKEEGQEQVYAMLLRFTYTTCHMELRGWPVDMEYAQSYLQDLNDKIRESEKALLQESLVKRASKILEVKALEKVNAKRKNKLTKLAEPFQFNPKSTDHKRVLFFDVMRLPVVKYTKTRNEAGKRVTPSMDKEVMEKWSFALPAVAPFLDKIKQYSELCKMRSTYVEGIMAKAVKDDEGYYRIHPTYNVIGAKTGRLSSKSPNFQNLPVRNSEAKNVKRMIAARPGYILVGADLAAAEMRWACVCSGDTKLIQIFQAGLDIHGAIACEVFNLTCHPDEVKKKYPELRDISKTIQFLTLYGGGADTLASKVKIKPSRAKSILEQIMQETGLVEQVGTKLNAKNEVVPVWGEYDYTKLNGNAAAAARLVDLFKFPQWKAEAVINARDKSSALMSAFEIERDEAQDILDAYFEKYAGVAQYIADTENFVSKNGYSLSLLGRKRRVPEVNSDDSGVAERGVRQAVNATIQSIASDGLMLSACGIQEDVLDHEEEPKLLMLGPIHDALYFEVREDYVREAHDLIIDYMSRFPVESPIPMVADAEYGKDWAHFSEDFAELYQELYGDNWEDGEEEEDSD